MFAHEHKRSARWRRRPVLTAAAIALALPIAVVLLAADPTALCLLPMVALALPLWLRRYPGERLLAALRHSGRVRRGRNASPPRAPLPPLPTVVRGGLLLACSLAVRPPPRRALAAAAG